MMTHNEFVEKECHYCGSQRCYGVDYCAKYKKEVLGIEDEFTKAYMNEYRVDDDDISDEEYEVAAQEVHDELVRSLIEAGGEIRELRELLSRAYEQILLLGYDSMFTNEEIEKLMNDIREYYRGVMTYRT